MRQSTFESLERRQLMSGTTAVLNAGGVLTVTGTSGNDVLMLQTSNYSKVLNVYEFVGTQGVLVGSFNAFTLKRVDVRGGAGNDTIEVGTFHPLAMVYGEAGNDTLTGAAHGDYLFGGDGDDVIDGRFGDDFVFGGNGHDVMRDSDDNGQGSGADYVSGGGGTDRIDYSWRHGWGGVTIRLDGSATSGRAGEKDRLYDDIERATGTDSADTLVGNKSANVLNGGSGNDTINGLGGNDDLYGDSGNDILTGGDGTDYMIGGKGHDTFFALDAKGGDTIWGDNKGVYNNANYYDVAYVDDSITNDVAYCTAKNYWVKS